MKKMFLFFLRSGCRSTSSGEPLPTDCNACLHFKRVDTDECVESCPEGFKEKDATCVPSERVLNDYEYESMLLVHEENIE